MTDQNEVRRLGEIANAAADAVRKLESERDQKARDAAQAVRNEYGPKLRVLTDAAEAARRAVFEARLAATKNHEWEGKIVTREETQYSRYSSRVTGVKTVRGFVRTYRPGVELPMNRNNYVSIGDVLVFALKKDGTPGKDYERFERHATEWKLEEGQPG